MAEVAFLSEADCERLVTSADALEAMRALFAEMADDHAINFPVVRERTGLADATYGVKSGVNRAQNLLGLKIGGYWPGNTARGLARHQSTVVLTNPETGQPIALVGGNHLTALRTAAAAALSIDLLARPEARTLGILGAGGQALSHAQAALAVRAFDRVLVWNRTSEGARQLAAALGPIATVEDTAEAVVAASDVVVTITGATSPLFDGAAVKPGTHFACMGSDTAGKGEAPADLLARATLFTDAVAQSLTLGEGQRAPEGKRPTPLGEIIVGRHPGRSSAEEVTLFDGTGIGLQDLAMAQFVLRKAEAAGEVDRRPL